MSDRPCRDASIEVSLLRLWDWQRRIAQSRHAEFGSCHRAIVSAWNTGPADVRPQLIDAAGRGSPDFARQRRASCAAAGHSAQIGRDEFFGDQIEMRIRFQAEARPLRGIRAAGAARLAVDEGRGVASGGIVGTCCGGTRGRRHRVDLRFGRISFALSLTPTQIVCLAPPRAPLARTCSSSTAKSARRRFWANCRSRER